ncbi:hypothetical protein BU16DRAFT_275607 [Lophium mytilinum]|uniref:Uncharacterized protein n=1 Tax=Lophium mytilinum TaxID=390894 RepID=A0A6A6R576_9PEZI|nr:hypothetical protein BU16DRAFT_275607 [Lophium mytilinum]
MLGILETRSKKRKGILCLSGMSLSPFEDRYACHQYRLREVSARGSFRCICRCVTAYVAVACQTGCTRRILSCCFLLSNTPLVANERRFVNALGINSTIAAPWGSGWIWQITAPTKARSVPRLGTSGRRTTCPWEMALKMRSFQVAGSAKNFGAMAGPLNAPSGKAPAVNRTLTMVPGRTDVDTDSRVQSLQIVPPNVYQ